MKEKNNIEGSGDIWVIADHSQNRIAGVTLQLVGKARELANALEKKAVCLILGHEITGMDLLFEAGADIVYRGDSQALQFYQQSLFTELIIDLAVKQKPDMIFLGNTHTGRELAPLLAAALGTGLSAHCVDLCLGDDGILEQKIPAYGGLMTIICPEKKPQMATCAAGVFPMPELSSGRRGKIIDLDVPEGGLDRICTLEVVEEQTSGPVLENAPLVIAGGAGMGSKEGWSLLENLAERLHAALGCTRPAVDEGWAQLDTMIGQSGKMINPDMYIGVGLSGELQHMVGIMDAKLMIAVNSDEKSPVFEQVDYGVVDDCREFIPLLIEKIENA